MTVVPARGDRVGLNTFVKVVVGAGCPYAIEAMRNSESAPANLLDMDAIESDVLWKLYIFVASVLNGDTQHATPPN